MQLDDSICRKSIFVYDCGNGNVLASGSFDDYDNKFCMHWNVCLGRMHSPV